MKCRVYQLYSRTGRRLKKAKMIGDEVSLGCITSKRAGTLDSIAWLGRYSAGALQQAHVQWIAASGLSIIGLEEIHNGYRHQEWFCNTDGPAVKEDSHEPTQS